MQSIIDFFQFLLNSEEIIRTGGLVTITLIIYAENGLFFGFFLPGDYLLFLAGIFCGTKILAVSIWLLMGCILGAAVLGSLTGYVSGRFFGGNIETRKDSFFFKKEYIANTRKYFEKYGSQTLVIARFLPVIRTFAPILAGITNMRFYDFMLYNVLGGIVWTLTLVGGGYYLGERYPWIIDFVPYVIVFFLGITTFTVIKGYRNARKEF